MKHVQEGSMVVTIIIFFSILCALLHCMWQSTAYVFDNAVMRYQKSQHDCFVQGLAVCCADIVKNNFQNLVNDKGVDVYTLISCIEMAHVKHDISMQVTKINDATMSIKIQLADLNHSLTQVSYSLMKYKIPTIAYAIKDWSTSET